MKKRNKRNFSQKYSTPRPQKSADSPACTESKPTNFAHNTTGPDATAPSNEDATALLNEWELRAGARLDAAQTHRAALFTPANPTNPANPITPDDPTAQSMLPQTAEALAVEIPAHLLIPLSPPTSDDPSSHPTTHKNSTRPQTIPTHPRDAFRHHPNEAPTREVDSRTFATLAQPTLTYPDLSPSSQAPNTHFPNAHNPVPPSLPVDADGFHSFIAQPDAHGRIQLPAYLLKTLATTPADKLLIKIRPIPPQHPR